MSILRSIGKCASSKKHLDFRLFFVTENYITSFGNDNL
jgi:hypothetical protein